jgi:DNA (cytosine-5)-methyltransferase 1
MKPTVIDLFCGCGGLSSGFSQAGFKILGGLDKNDQALVTFQRNFPRAQAIAADLSQIGPDTVARQFGLRRGELDCLIGGPPCQGFSKNVPAADRFLDDPRNSLMRVFLDFVERLQPKFVLIENVAEVLRAYEGAVSSEITGRLNDLGYEVESAVLNSANFGVPQLRRRAFFLAGRTKRVAHLPSPTHVYKEFQPQLERLFKKAVSVWDAIGDLPALEAGAGSDPCAYSKSPGSEFQHLVRNGDEHVYNHVARRLTPIQLKRIKCLGPGEGINDLPDEIRPAQGYSGAYARLRVEEPARTITRWVFHPGSGRFVHPTDDRVITIREAARLQSFPDNFVFEGTYIEKSHQVGEAVPPLLSKAIAGCVRDRLG